MTLNDLLAAADALDISGSGHRQIDARRTIITDLLNVMRCRELMYRDHSYANDFAKAVEGLRQFPPMTATYVLRKAKKHPGRVVASIRWDIKHNPETMKPNPVAALVAAEQALWQEVQRRFGARAAEQWNRFAGRRAPQLYGPMADRCAEYYDALTDFEEHFGRHYEVPQRGRFSSHEFLKEVLTR